MVHAGTFLRGVLEKVGVEPQVKRIGKSKSAGDQLLLRDMSEPQREQLTALLEDIYEGFTSTIAHDRTKSVEEVSLCKCLPYWWHFTLPAHPDPTTCIHPSRFSDA